jgi:hypothetical protein
LQCGNAASSRIGVRRGICGFFEAADQFVVAHFSVPIKEKEPKANTQVTLGNSGEINMAHRIRSVIGRPDPIFGGSLAWIAIVSAAAATAYIIWTFGF